MWRRRKCTSCHRTFTTREKIDFNGVVTVINKHTSTPYSREKLLLSLVQASHNLALSPEILSELTDSIEQELGSKHFFESKNNESSVITRAALAVLSRYNKNLALQYVNLVYDNNPPLELLQSLLND